MTTNTDGAMPELPVALYHHAEADGTFLPSESCVCEDDVYTNNGDDETIGVPLVRLSDARAAIQQAAGAVPEGCRIVPMEPSKAMLDRAVAFALNVSIGGSYGWTDYMRDLYARMLSAVPSKAGSSDHSVPCAGGGVTQPLTEAPRWQFGTWTLTAPDGRTWQADSPLKACSAEQRDRIQPEVALKRIFDALDKGE